MMIKKIFCLISLIFAMTACAEETGGFDYQKMEVGKSVSKIQEFTQSEAEAITKMKFTPVDFLEQYKNILFFQKTGSNTFFITFPPLELENETAFADVIEDFEKVPKADRARDMTAEKVAGEKVVRSLYYAQKDKDFYIYNSTYFFNGDKLVAVTSLQREEFADKFVEKKDAPKKLLILKQRDGDLKKETEKEKKEKIAEFLKNAAIKHKESVKEYIKGK